MERPSKKQIREGIEQLKAKPTSDGNVPNPQTGKLAEKKLNQRIRKQGV
jgi:hypothetical protein